MEAFYFLTSHTTRASSSSRKASGEPFAQHPKPRRKRSSGTFSGDMETLRDTAEALAQSTAPVPDSTPANTELSTSLANLGLTGGANPAVAPSVLEPAVEGSSVDPGAAATGDANVHASSTPTATLLSPMTGEKVIGEEPLSSVPIVETVAGSSRAVTLVPTA